MRTSSLTIWASLLILAVSAVLAEAPPTNADAPADAEVARSAQPPEPPSVGRFDRNKVYTSYWRRTQHAESIRRFNEDFRALRGAEEPEQMTLRRIRIQRAGRRLEAQFETDLRQAMGTVAVRHGTFVVVRGQPYYQAQGVKTVDLTEALTAELSVAPAEPGTPE